MTAARPRLPAAARGAVLPLALLVGWSIVAGRGGAQGYAFPPLGDVAASFAEAVAGGELIDNWIASVARATTGFLIGATLGLALGAAMAASRAVDGLVSPLYHAVRQVPLLGLVPLISLWIGNGESSKLFVIALAAFYPTVLNTYEGLRTTDARHRAVARIFKLGRWAMLRHVTLPAAMPSILTGIMQATAFTWLSAIGTEFFFNPGPGLGNLMLNAQAALRMDRVLMCVALIALTGFGVNVLIAQTARQSLRWRSTR